MEIKVCLKCGSTNISTERRPYGFNWCNECGHRWQNGVKQPEPTTAEMLLWLAENESIDIWHTATEGIIYVWINGDAVKFKGKTLSEAIKQAYDWAIKEEK